MDLGLKSESHFRSLLESDEEMSVVISDPFQKDNPMIFVSDEFENKQVTQAQRPSDKTVDFFRANIQSTRH